MAFIAGAIIGAVAGVGSSIIGGRNARKAQQSQNEANARLADEANEYQREMYLRNRGASGEDIRTGRYEDARSAVLPYYSAQLEEDLANRITQGYDALTEAYNPMGEYGRIQDLRDDLSFAEQGMIDTVNDVYSGEEMSEGLRHLNSILGQRERNAMDMGSARYGNALLTGGARLDGQAGVSGARDSASMAEALAILNEGQRNAAMQDFTGRSGIVGNSGNAQANTLQALMNAYTQAGVNAANNRVLNAQDEMDVNVVNAQEYGDARLDTFQDLANARERAELERFALYEQNLANRKNFAQTTDALNAVANNATAGMNTVYTPENITSDALKRAGMQIGVGTTPEYNTPVYTAPVKSNPLDHVNAGINSGLSGYMLANAISNSAAPTPTHTSTINRNIS